MSTTKILAVVAVAGWAVAARVAVGWALEARARRDLDSLLDESELERLQLRAWYERTHPERAARFSPVARVMAGLDDPLTSPGRAADRAPGRESTTLHVVEGGAS